MVQLKMWIGAWQLISLVAYCKFYFMFPVSLIFQPLEISIRWFSIGAVKGGTWWGVIDTKRRDFGLSKKKKNREILEPNWKGLVPIIFLNIYNLINKIFFDIFWWIKISFFIRVWFYFLLALKELKIKEFFTKKKKLNSDFTYFFGLIFK